MAFKNIAGQILKIIFYKDIISTQKISAQYIHGKANSTGKTNNILWNNLERSENIRKISCSYTESSDTPPPFVYYKEIDSSLLVINQLRIDTLLTNSPDEFTTIRKIGTWIGSLWDHGMGPLPGDVKYIKIQDIVKLASNRNKYWCEVAAVMTVKTFAHLNWPSRLISASQTGEFFQHGIAEVWSNQHKKWILVDTDFNLIYLKDSTPLSAYEICHNYHTNKMERPEIIRLGTNKPSLQLIDVIPFYNYVSMDLRNDWEQRSLHRGSPSNGSLSTWWTFRDSLPGYYFPGKTINLEDKFNWQINRVTFTPGKVINSNNSRCLQIYVHTYSPYFKNFEIKIDSTSWTSSDSIINWKITNGKHIFKAKVKTYGPYDGPTDSLEILAG